jgi:hypothetical protein
MAGRDSRDGGDADETILEYVVRERLGRPQIRELLDGLGSQTSGNKEEMAERLLSLRGLKDQDVLKLLDLDDLKRVQKRFAVPAPSGTGGLVGMFLGDEKGDIVKAIVKVAGQQRAPRPKSSKGTETGPDEGSIPAPASSSAAAQPPRVLPSQPPTHKETAPASARPAAGPPTPGPSFEDVCAFVDIYRFRSQWPKENHYEAELYGALTAKFHPSVVSRQERKSYGIPDITVKASVLPSGSIPTYIEMKVPENPGQVRQIEDQVKKYLEGGATNLIVVLVGDKMGSKTHLDDMAYKLESMNVRVARKYS